MADPTWNDLPAGGRIDIFKDYDGDVVINIEGQDDSQASVYMGPQQAREIALILQKVADQEHAT